jgi:mRNA-degrading endonuclease YafQ of YafQ-DinJ toxin-antitoxin module
MQKHHPFHRIVGMLIIASLIGGCALLSPAQSKTVTLEGEEREAVLEYAAPMGENLISGLVNRDYATFSKDFDATMKKGMDEAAFEKLLSTLTDKLGAYQSHEISQVLQDEKYTIVIYRLTYEKDNLVTMRIVFNRAEPHLISGLWFDSPELRKK